MIDVITVANSTINSFSYQVGKRLRSQNLLADLLITASSSKVVTSTVLNSFSGIPRKEMSTGDVTENPSLPRSVCSVVLILLILS